MKCHVLMSHHAIILFSCNNTQVVYADSLNSQTMINDGGAFLGPFGECISSTVKKLQLKSAGRTPNKKCHSTLK